MLGFFSLDLRSRLPGLLIVPEASGFPELWLWGPLLQDVQAHPALEAARFGGSLFGGEYATHPREGKWGLK